MRRFIVFLALTATPAAAQTPRIPGAVRIDPPVAFRRDWAKAEVCVGVQKNFDDMVWWEVPGGSFRDPVGEQVLKETKGIRYWGIWVRPDTIYVSKIRPEWVVRHEVIHYLRNQISHDDRVNHVCGAPYSQIILDNEERAKRAAAAE